MQNPSTQATKYHRFYLFSLFSAILVLPLFEAPKTLFLLLFFILSALGLWKNRAEACWGGDDILLLAWMASGFIVAQFAAIHYKEWGGANGPLLLGLLLFFLKRAKVDNTITRLLLFTVLLSTSIANIDGIWQLITGGRKALELKSVGHVNHSAIYLCLNFGLALAMALTLKREDTLPVKLFIAASLLLTTASIVISNSRATVLTMGAIALLFGLFWTQRSKLPLLVILLAVAAVSGGLYLGNARVVQKHLQQTAHGSFLGERAPIWNSALLAWRHAPLFGLGIKNYAQATAEMQEKWLAEEGKTYVSGRYLPYAHAHSLYLTLLAEQGLFGFTLTLAVLTRIGWLLYRNRPRAAAPDDYWALWLAASGALMVVLVNGVFNTTLHHEHGLLSVFLLGLWWSSIERRDHC